MGMSRLEINLRRLLSQCEEQAKDDLQKDWRLEKYIESLDQMMGSLQNIPNKPGKDTMCEYGRRVSFLKGLIQTDKLPTATEKVVAAQLLSHGPATSIDPATKEIHQKASSKYNKELRDQLFQTDKNSSPERTLKHRSQKASAEELDALLKYHHSMQEKIADDMLLLTRNLKEQSQLANTIIKKDIEVVDKSSKEADKNYDKLKVASERLAEHNRRAWKCWMWVILVLVFLVFINMVMFMKFYKKRK